MADLTRSEPQKIDPDSSLDSSSNAPHDYGWKVFFYFGVETYFQKK